ncbi:MAG: hypothetical protein DYH12_34875 [Sorangiineae bacterium PRO1]|nr:hypothetical protein [Sorangiineae bacterium PRO1]
MTDPDKTEGESVFSVMLSAIEQATPKNGFNLVEVDEYEPPGEELYVHLHFDSREEAVEALARYRRRHPGNVFYVYAAEGEDPVLDEPGRSPGGTA